MKRLLAAFVGAVERFVRRWRFLWYMKTAPKTWECTTCGTKYNDMEKGLGWKCWQGHTLTKIETPNKGRTLRFYSFAFFGGGGLQDHLLPLTPDSTVKLGLDAL